MSDTIDVDGVTYTPTFLDGYEASRESRTVEHGEVAVVLRPAAPRTGRLRAQFPVEADAFAFMDAIADTATGALSSTDRPALDMAFFTPSRGGVAIALDKDTRTHWWVEFDYKEIVT